MPGARHSKFSKPGRSIRERYGSRKIESRSPLPIIVIVCDDSRTAPAYFDAQHREVRQHVALKIVRASCQTTAASAVDRAIAEFGKVSVDREEKDAVWALIDLEHEEHLRKQAQAARKRAEESGVRVALSDPCFEVWTLLHLEDTGEAFANCGQVIKRIEGKWKVQFGQPFPRKAKADYSKIVMMRHEAARRARQRWDAQDPSRTEVYRIIEEIESRLPKPGSEASS